MRIRIGICVLAAAAITALLHAQIPVSDRANLDDYVRTVRSAQAGGGSVEAAFAKATAVCSLLLRIDDSEALRESLSAEDVRALQTLPGILVTGDLNSARPDQQFFSALAQAHGTPADRRFFETMNFTSPPGQWAIYLDGASTWVHVPATARGRWWPRTGDGPIFSARFQIATSSAPRRR